jgi:hypothetical protein
MSRFSQWEPYQRYVQAGTVDGEFMNASFTLLAAGPPRLANVGGSAFFAAGAEEGAIDEIVFPIGIVQNFNLSHNRQFNRVWEIGSERSFFISGRTVGQVGMSRVLYHGPSLLRVMYAYFQDVFDPTIIPSVIGGFNVGAALLANPHNVKIPPGFQNLFLNLASDMFSQPVGMMAYFRNSNELTIGAGYMEACYVPNHTIATDAQGTIVQENIALQFERLVPVAVNAIDLIGLDASDQEALGL